jgi:hypothetical protein
VSELVKRCIGSRTAPKTASISSAGEFFLVHGDRVYCGRQTLREQCIWCEQRDRLAEKRAKREQA